MGKCSVSEAAERPDCVLLFNDDVTVLSVFPPHTHFFNDRQMKIHETNQATGY